MTLTIQCPNPACGNTATVPKDLLGRKVMCKRCKQPFTIKAADTVSCSPAPACPGSGRGEDNRTVTRVRPTPSTAAGEAIPPRGSGAELPERVGRFQIRARVGCGAFGTVYRAFDPKLEREVAVKVPRTEKMDSPTRVKRFLREAKAAAHLHHPHIVTVYEAGSEEGQHYIASAFIEGRTLEQAMAEMPLAFPRTAELVRDLAEALAYAHEVGVVHRDVKPANVMVNDQGQPFLMDFGLAHRLEEADKLTQDGTVLGTPAYMAPEQAAGSSAAASFPCDQYSLGVVLYELLCGQTPFAGTPQMLLFNTVHTDPPAPRTLNPKIPRDLETICLKAMAKRPEDRYRSCQRLADDLRRWLEGEPIKARRLGLAERLVRWCRREPRLVAAVAVALVCLLAVATIASVSWARVAEAAQGEALARQKAEDLNNQVRQLLEADQVDEARRALGGRAKPLQRPEKGSTREKPRDAGRNLARPSLPENSPKEPAIADLIARGKKALALKQFQVAEEAFLDALALGPKDRAAVKKLLQDVHMEQKKVDQQNWARARQVAQRRDRLLAFKGAMKDGQQHLDKLQFEEASRDYNDAVHFADAPADKGAAALKGKEAQTDWYEALAGAAQKKAADKEKETRNLLLDMREWQSKGELYLKLEHKWPVEAIEYYQKIVDLKPPPTVDVEALQHFRQYQQTGATRLKTAKALLDKKTTEYNRAMKLGAGASRRKDYSHAAESYIKAIFSAPSEDLYLKARKGRDEAIQHFVKGLKQNNANLQQKVENLQSAVTRLLRTMKR